MTTKKAHEEHKVKKTKVKEVTDGNGPHPTSYLVLKIYLTRTWKDG